MPSRKTIRRGKPVRRSSAAPASAEMAASEAKFRMLHEPMRDAFVSVDMAGQILEFNSAYREMLGYPAAELCTQTYLDLTPQNWHAMEARIVAEEVLPRGYSGVYEKEYRRKDGTVFPVELRTFLIRDSAGEPAMMWAIVRDITERKAIEAALARLNATLERQVAERTAALRESEEQYRQLIQGLPVALSTCDARGRIMRYNAAAVKLWGCEPKVGRDRWTSAHRLFTPEGTRLPLARTPTAMAIRQGEPIRDTELIVERRDGSRSHVLAFADPTYDRSGAINGAVNMLVDITALKVAENAVRTSERNLRKLSRAVEQSPTSILITSPSGEIEYVNPKFTDVTGYPLAEVLGKNPRLLKSGEHPPELYRDMWKTITAGDVWRSVLCNRKKNGEQYWEFAVIAPILDEHGVVTHFVAIKEDITEQRRAASALHDREERLRAILNTVGDAIITIDRRGTITGVNPATVRMFGYTEAEMLGQNVSLLMPSPDCEPHDHYLENYDRTGKARIIGIGREALARRRDGSIFPADLAVSEVKEMGLSIGVIRDISRRKQLETEVLRITEEERQRVAADLHDGICQELAGIQYLAHSLRRDLERTHHPAVAQARRIENAIGGAIGGTRQVARGMNPVIADGSGLMHALRRLAETTTRTHRIRCSFHCAAPVPIENPTAANELYRIAQEAIHNAVRHGRPKRITVRLSEAGGGVHLAVLDNGHGLPADLSGTPGMGLRVMRYRAGMIGGQLSIQPRRSSGTAVICQLPKPLAKP